MAEFFNLAWLVFQIFALPRDILSRPTHISTNQGILTSKLQKKIITLPNGSSYHVFAPLSTLLFNKDFYCRIVLKKRNKENYSDIRNEPNSHDISFINSKSMKEIIWRIPIFFFFSSSTNLKELKLRKIDDTWYKINDHIHLIDHDETKHKTFPRPYTSPQIFFYFQLRNHRCMKIRRNEEKEVYRMYTR